MQYIHEGGHNKVAKQEYAEEIEKRVHRAEVNVVLQRHKMGESNEQGVRAQHLPAQVFWDQFRVDPKDTGEENSSCYSGLHQGQRQVVLMCGLLHLILYYYRIIINPFADMQPK